ncbi:MAG: DNA internalization-related competence protein ComEC/Rec2, partial [Mariprofundaceae bacterium]|nr:DNA internalization-related competence protein ComEC/Rec2 [Mariprofundaceae bacterium]
KVMVIDVAGRFGSRFNAGTSMVEGLRGMGLTHIDVLLISHNQSDHVGGAFSLLHRVNSSGELWLADVPENRQSGRIEALSQLVLSRGGVVRWLRQGDSVAFAGSEGDVLWPPLDYAPANVNDDSLVLHLRLPTSQYLLFGGDIEAPVEAALLSQQRQALRTDIMLMPHHGSASSSTQAFVAATRPSLVIAQTGYANRYGFPSQIVQARYRAVGASLLNTADGAVVLDLHDTGGYSLRPVEPVESLKRNRALQWWQHFL